MYSGDEFYGDEITSGPINRGGEPEDVEPYCNACDQFGHDESDCPAFEDEDAGDYSGSTGDYGQYD